jgi:hypothetical protein
MKQFATALLALLLASKIRCVLGFKGVGVGPFSTSRGIGTISATTTTQLHGLFDFKPFHGRGSGESRSELDEQWEAQQEILRARRGHLDKTHLKQKYANGAAPKDGTFAGKGGGRVSMDDMWIDDRPRNAKGRQNQAGGGKNRMK